MFKWLEQYFTFSKGERNAVVVLVLLCFVALLAPKFYLWYKPVQHADNSEFQELHEAAADSTDMERSDSIAVIAADLNKPVTDLAAGRRSETGRRGDKYFDFDPNKIGLNEWMKLGFSEKQAHVIENYKGKGGKFYRPEDMMRLYVMDEPHYNQLRPYVKIDVEALPKRNYKRD